jgi:GH24 family phage-related lysozyme (muramidase)
MTDPRKVIFDNIRDARGKGFDAMEVGAIDNLLDALGVPRGHANEEWLDLAAPLVEKWEGYAKRLPDGSVKAYPDPATGGAPWTIGVGSTTDEQGKPIQPGTVWTRERAMARFKAHLREFGEGVDRLLDGAPTTPAQKAAMTSLAYNVGLGAFGGSTLLKRHKAGLHGAAADQFRRWNRAGGKVMQGLTNRRADEADLYRRGL